jgi:hypothetical protein
MIRRKGDRIETSGGKITIQGTADHMCGSVLQSTALLGNKPKDPQVEGRKFNQLQFIPCFDIC